MENEACFEDASSDQEYNDEANRKKPLDEPNSAQRQQYPHQSIVCITWTSPTSSKKLPSYSALRSSRSTTHPKIPDHGTGFFITPQLILTCAHNLYDLDKKKISQQICISFGDRHSSSDAIPIADFRFSGQYKSFLKQNKANLQYDYGLIKLQKPVKLQKYFILCVNFSNQHEKIKTFGYPEFTRTSEGGVEKYVCSQKGDFGDRQEPYILKLFDWKMKHFLNTREGLSGSPIILGDSNLIVGVHKASVVKKGDKDKNFLYNVARRIDPEMVDNIKTWAAEMNLSGEDIIVVDYEKIKGEQFLQQWGLPQSSPQKMLEEEIGQQKQSTFPYNCIGYLSNTYDEDIICGTGFLIAPDLVLTLLSSLFTKLEQYSKAVDSTRIRNPSIFFYLENQKYAKHLNGIEVQEIAAFPERLNLKLGFVHNHITSYCLLKLKQKITRKQYFKLSLEEHQLNTPLTPLQIAGYLCPFRKQYDYQRSQWKVEHQIVRKITTKVDTRQRQTSMKLLLYYTLGQAGMVGSPLWDQDGHVQAIHHGILTKQPIIFAGRTITLDLVSQLYVWKDKLHGSSFETVFQGQNGRVYVNSLKALEDSLTSIMSRSLGYSDQF